MKKRIIVYIIYALLILVIVFTKFYSDYKTNKILKKKIVTEEAKALTALLLSYRQTYHDAFIDNNIPIDKRTVYLLPVKRMKDIGEDFSSRLKNKTIIRTVSDRPRNIENMANETELEIISFFNKNKNEKFYYLDTDKGFIYATPLYIKKSCLNCHGKREDAIETIKNNYDKAYNYKLGDLRGIISIYMSKQNIILEINENFRKSLFLALCIYSILLYIGWLLMKVIIKDEKKFTEKLETKVNEKTQELKALNETLALKNNELKNAEIKAQESTKLKSEFLANMSHEIRTPMNAILGFSEILQSRLTKEENKSLIDKITLSGNNLISLINDILDISKIEAGQLKITKEYTDLHKTINNITNIFQAISDKKKIPINVYIDKQVPRFILTDYHRINQILVNLVGNSLKFTNEGTIDISLEIKKTNNNELNDFTDIFIKVKDTGIGIPENQIDNIFENFRQVEGQKTRKFGGTGLGLAITKKLVKLLGGKISVQSKEGKGTIFTILFENIKVLPEKQENLAELSLIKETLKFKNKIKILHVEDVEMNREIITLFSKNNNIEIKDAKNGQEALEILKTYTPDLILMDIQMPVMNGYDATVIIRKDKRLEKIPILAITANATKEEKNKYGDVFDDYLTKPITNKTFLTAVRKFVKSKLQ